MNLLSAWPFSCPLSLNPLPHWAVGLVSLGCHCYQCTHKRQPCFFYSSWSNWASAFLTSPPHAWAMPLSEITRKATPNSTFSVHFSFAYLQSRFCSSSLWVSAIPVWLLSAYWDRPLHLMTLSLKVSQLPMAFLFSSSDTYGILPRRSLNKPKLFLPKSMWVYLPSSFWFFQNFKLYSPVVTAIRGLSYLFVLMPQIF